MKKYMIHIETEEFYDLYMDLRSIFRNTMCRKLGLKTGDLYNEFLADKRLIEKLDECLQNQNSKIEELQRVYIEYTGLRKKLHFRNWVPEKKKYSITGNLLAIIFSIITWPLVFLGLFNNWPHFFIPVRFTRGIRDKQFFSTAKWGAGFALMTIYYMILFVVSMIFLPVWWIKILYLITLPSSGIFALKYRAFIIKAWARIRYSFLIRKKNSDAVKLKSDYDKIVLLTEKIVNN